MCEVTWPNNIWRRYFKDILKMLISSVNITPVLYSINMILFICFLSGIYYVWQSSWIYQCKWTVIRAPHLTYYYFYINVYCFVFLFFPLLFFITLFCIINLLQHKRNIFLIFLPCNREPYNLFCDLFI
jgi:hypothetical protein